MTESRWGRLGAVSGIVFAVLFLASLFVPDLPSGSDANASSGARSSVIITAYLMGLAGIAFLGFLASLYRGLREAEGEAGTLATLALAAGVLFVAMLYASGSAWVAVPAGIEFGQEPQPTSDVAIWLTQLGFGTLLAYGMFSAIVVIVATSVLALRKAVLPGWLAWTGLVCAALLVFGVFYVPMIALPVWAIATSVAMLKHPAAQAQRAAQPASVTA